MCLKFAQFKNLHRQLLAVTALALLGCLMLLLAAEGYEPLHRWLHGGTISDDDDCAVVLLATGKVDVSATAQAVIPVIVVVAALVQTFISPLIAKLPLPHGRGPPFHSFSRLA